jgi:biopolymer transport protein ExbB/TolQ
MASFYDIFNSSLHAISQSLLIPVMVVLALFFIYALINLGILVAEYYKRRKVKTDIKVLIGQLMSVKSSGDPEKIKEIVNSAEIPASHKEVLRTMVDSRDTSPEYRESLALKLVEDEGIAAAKKLERTDIIAKIAPAVGLMGTLIPLGPGLTALGVGNIQSLAQHLLIAFDAAVLGMASAAVAFTISKIKRRWYEEELSDLETLADTLLEIMK